MDNDKLMEYLKGIKDGERVIETSRLCMHLSEGTVYRKKDGRICVKWDKLIYGGYMSTLITGGTRRLHEQDLTF